MSDQPKKKSAVFAVCMTVAVLAALAIGGVFGYRAYVRDFFEGRCAGYLRALKAGNPRWAYKRVGDAWHAAQSKDDFIAFHKRMFETLGRLRDVSIERAQTDGPDAPNPTAVLVLDARFERGRATMTLVFGREYVRVVKESYDEKIVKDAEDWFIRNVTFESELLPGSPIRTGVGQVNND